MPAREHVGAWLAAYERAWRSPGTAALRDLFVEDATYQMSPYEQPVVGLAAIGAMWDEEREGPDEEFVMTTDVVAVDGDISVVRVEVRYGEPVVREYRDLWVVRFGEDGRCVAFEEWPFWPGQPLADPAAR
jgi:ketosteroid isomerase-like protein